MYIVVVHFISSQDYAYEMQTCVHALNCQFFTGVEAVIKEPEEVEESGTDTQPMKASSINVCTEQH